MKHGEARKFCTLLKKKFDGEMYHIHYCPQEFWYRDFIEEQWHWDVIVELTQPFKKLLYMDLKRFMELKYRFDIVFSETSKLVFT